MNGVYTTTYYNMSNIDHIFMYVNSGIFFNSPFRS